MKKHYGAIIGIVLLITIVFVIWTERIHSHRQDVTIVEMVLPKPDLPVGDFALLTALNDQLRTYSLDKVRFFQGFQSEYSSGLVSGNFSYDQIEDIRKKLGQLSEKSPEITLTPVFEGRVQLNRALQFRDDSSFKLIAEPGTTPIEAAVKWSPEDDVLPAMFYDGHTILFGKTSGDELHILFITVINPKESMFQRAVNFLVEIFE